MGTLVSDRCPFYTGLAISAGGTRALLYASDFRNRKIDMFDTTYARVTLVRAWPTSRSTRCSSRPGRTAMRTACTDGSTWRTEQLARPAFGWPQRGHASQSGRGGRRDDDALRARQAPGPGRHHLLAPGTALSAEPWRGDLGFRETRLFRDAWRLRLVPGEPRPRLEYPQSIICSAGIVAFQGPGFTPLQRDARPEGSSCFLKERSCAPCPCCSPLSCFF